MSDWVCKECAEKFPDIYEDATLLDVIGFCEKCDKECADGLFVPRRFGGEEE